MLLLVSSYTLDLIIGDPENFPHPVRLIGKFTQSLEGFLRGTRLITGASLRARGFILAILVAGLTAIIVYLLLDISRKINPFLGNLVWIYLGYTAISCKDLRVKVKDIYTALKAGNIALARKELSKIVGRDTQYLDDKQVITAAVESIAESTNDGIVAPIFYLALGGPVLALGYKAVNTLDSMLGYRNERYKDFGWFSARLDDAANFIPARISGFLTCAASFIAGNGFVEPFKIMLRDGRKHPSPNSGISEAAMAGALGIRLGGSSAYQGKIVTKPYIGEEKSEIQPLLLNKALSISFLVSVIIVGAGALLLRHQ